MTNNKGETMNQLTKQQQRNEALKAYKTIKDLARKAYAAIKDPAWETYDAIAYPAREAYLAKLKEINNAPVFKENK